ncbi:hypothetical protein ACW5EG_07750 [Luteimonas sp. A611]
MSDIPLTGEVSNSKLAAVFDSQRAAREAAAALCRDLDLAPPQVKVISADSTDVDIQLEPEGGNIWHTIIRAHMWLGIWGAVLGLVAFGLLYWGGVPFIVQSPVAAILALLFFGSTAGLLLGGLVSLRPDHDRYIHATHDAMEQGRTTIVVHALSSEQRSRAAEFLAARGADVTQTL